MNNRDIQLKKLFGNYEKLEDTNKDKLLLIGKKLLRIKTLIEGGNTSGADKMKARTTGHGNN
jgi:hypothetical protein